LEPGDTLLDLKLAVPFGVLETIQDCEVVAALVLPAEVEIVWRVVFPVNSTGPKDDGPGAKDEAVVEIPSPLVLIPAAVDDWTVDGSVIEDVRSEVDGEALDVTMAEGDVRSRELVEVVELVTTGGGVDEVEPGTGGVACGGVAGVAGGGGGGGGRSTLLAALAGGPF
jgi:hypothetical protein